ncbi:MAG TPA: pyridoxal-phosphate dependent enzyme, partial [Vicinamibacterales bacterium]|nr:pyridoxal-phosphate dependent enzyme [Vicinamibacterales bacterium]
MARNISINTVRAAASRIYHVARRTPLIRLDPAGRSTPEIFLKLEVLQPIGSFKIRGAVNAMAQLTPSELSGGVWTVSAGNAAQGVALAAREYGASASVLVMDTAPAIKLAAIERLGATIVKATYDECWRAVETH